MGDEEFARNVHEAKRQAVPGPVVITDQGEPSFVLLSAAEYRRLRARGSSLVERLSMEDDDIEFEPARLLLRTPCGYGHVGG
ncbi:MAG: type II toxin-antitoxin system prevent-host-death family antitoxin [Mobilicoccus sp.]|nr:type II toxin-antitoxin system prevent-host-death family antitoxin [Mobilicoccus sp.]